MRLGVMLQAGSTGAWRYSERLIESLLREKLVAGVSIFHTTHYLDDLARLAGRWPGAISLIPLEPPKKYTSVRRVRLLQKKAEKLLGLSLPEDRNRRAMDQCDVLFCPWPYYEPIPRISRPVVFIPHDFTYSRNFGTTVVGPTLDEFEWQRSLHETWFAAGTCIVSSTFVRSELRRLFGEQHNPAVIPLAGFSCLGRLADDVAASRVKELGLAGRYILCVNNLCAHKNLGQLMGGYSLVRERFPDVRLVLAGAFSDNVSGICDNPWGLALSRDVQRAHVLGMGLVSDENLAALMQCSEFLVNPSLSEANNGPGLDAWEQGVPVAMSSIPPFLEHIDFLGVRAELFHPRCLYQIRDALLNLLENPGLAQENARHSAEMMKKWTWTEIAQRYAQVFGAAAGKS